MSGKERAVFLDLATFTADELPIPRFDHNWSEYPDTEAADIMPRLFWATTAITAGVSDMRGIAVQHLPPRCIGASADRATRNTAR